MSLTEKATKPHFYCSKCGYHGEKSNHKRPGADAPCDYFAIEAEATKPQEHKPLGPATAEDQAIYNSIVSNYFESGALDWMQNIDAAMKEPSFQEARALMGTENYGQDVALLQALRCLRSRMSNVTKPQEPAMYFIIDKDGDYEFNKTDKFSSGRTGGTPLYTTPQPCPKCAEGMVSVIKEDANNYCRILTLLGMEEEGSPVEGVERLISLRDGMTCGDCNDTGWLENREEGRYPCTCMTEAEPYQILQEKCVDLTSALAAKTADFDRLCKDFDEHDAELKRIIAGLRAELAQAKLYTPGRRAEAMPKTENGPCNYPYWRIIEKPAETPAEFVARHMATPSVLISAGGEE